ncbi:MAG: SH3 domain-containing protein [Pseudomonadota bacterium]
MARFMIVTFLMLGWVFFELSGGTDFEPPQQEARPLNELLQAVEREERVEVAQATTSPSLAPIVSEEPSEDIAALTRARFSGANEALVTVLGTATVPVQPVEEAVAEPLIVASSTADIRAVAGTRVNMRNGPGTSFPILATLTRGAEAEVIAEPGNGWLQIRVSDTGAVGWMAESLMQPVN